MVSEVNLSETVIQRYLDTHEGEFDKIPIPLKESLDVDKAMNSNDLDRFHKVIDNRKKAFAKYTNTFPPPMKHR